MWKTIGSVFALVVVTLCWGVMGLAGTETKPAQTQPSDAHAGHRHRDHDHKHGQHPPHADRHGDHHRAGQHAHDWHAIKQAVAVVHPTQGHHAHGVVRFTQVDSGVRIVADIQSLTPNAEHGFHIHQFGDCTSPDGKSAGGHYNPQGVPHAGPQDDHRHAGDLGNLKADDQGRARYDWVADNITIAGLLNPVIGRGIIIHAKADDLTSQPTGAAGARIGCGVIGVAKPGP